jgi:hypothetical protein
VEGNRKGRRWEKQEENVSQWVGVENVLRWREVK